jgi:hypothetical protein
MSTTFAIIADTGELVGAFTTRERADMTLASLGDGYTMILCDAETGIRVVHTWQCYAHIVDDEIDVWPPTIVVGSSRLVHTNKSLDDVERVEIEDKTSQLESIVTGQTVHNVIAYAASVDRARELATARAEELAREFTK